MTLIQCQLWNATYAANFSYASGVQDVSSTISSYVHTMDAILSVSAIALDDSYFRNWSYLAVMDVFQNYITGSISFPFNGNLGGSPTINTSMIVTSLVCSHELSPISTAISGLCWYRSSIGMKDQLENMFHNATLSLASQTLLLQNNTQQNTLVTAYISQNQYTYSATILWLAYGIAIGVSLISVLLGLHRVYSAKGGYETSFSTILRVAINVQLSNVINLSETSGMTPLPKRLENTLVYIPPSAQQAPAGLLPVPPRKQHVARLRPMWRNFMGYTAGQNPAANAAQAVP